MSSANTFSSVSCRSIIAREMPHLMAKPNFECIPIGRSHSNALPIHSIRPMRLQESQLWCPYSASTSNPSPILHQFRPGANESWANRLEAKRMKSMHGQRPPGFRSSSLWWSGKPCVPASLSLNGFWRAGRWSGTGCVRARPIPRESTHGNDDLDPTPAHLELLHIAPFDSISIGQRPILCRLHRSHWRSQPQIPTLGRPSQRLQIGLEVKKCWLAPFPL